MESNKIKIEDLEDFNDDEINYLIEEINDLEGKEAIHINRKLSKFNRYHLLQYLNSYDYIDKEFLEIYRRELRGETEPSEANSEALAQQLAKQPEKQTEETDEQTEKQTEKTDEKQDEKQTEQPEKSEYQITEDPEFSNGLISEEFEKNPFKGFVDLKDKNEIQIKQIGEKLKQIYETKIKTTALNQKINIGFYVKGEWIWRPLDNKNIKKAFEEMLKGNNVFEAKEMPKWKSDAETKLYFSFFDALAFRVAHDKPLINKSTHHTGGFYPYRLKSEWRCFKKWLRICAIGCVCYSEKHNCLKEWLKESCLVWAIRQYFIKEYGELTKEQIDLLINLNRSLVDVKYISSDNLQTIGKTYKLKFIVRAIDKDGFFRVQNKYRGGYYGSEEPDYTIELGLLENHYFLHFEVETTSFFIKNFKEISEYAKANNWSFEKCCRVIRKIKNGYQLDKTRAHIDSIHLITLLKENNAFEPLLRSDLDVDLACIHQWLGETPENALFEKPYERPLTNMMKIQPEIKKFNKPKEKHYYYADFETCAKDVVFNDIHTQQETPFMVCLQSEDGKEKMTFKGFDCAEQLMDYLPKGSIVYFHNLGFDGRLLMKHGVASNIMKGSKIISQKHYWKGKMITLKDSYSMFPQALRTFPESFKKEFDGLNIQKELFPYRYYTYDRLKENNLAVSAYQLDKYGIISEVGKDEYPPWTLEQKETFINNIKNIPGCLIDEDKFDMLKYCEFYCSQDVNVLRIGFNAFRCAALNEPIKTDIFELTTAPSLANEYLNKNVFFSNGKLWKYSGILQDYIMGAIYGGRCMTKQNKRWLVKDKIIDDFDACSLYPSAMARLFTVEGQPYIIPDEYLNTNYLLQHSFLENQTKPTEEKFITYFIVDIEITNIGVERDFPLIVEKGKETNMNVNKNIVMRVDLIMLEDLIKFQKIECKILRGIWWNGENRDLKIREVIAELFEQRAKYKKEGNSIQQVMKLIMNSGYGKSIQKPIKTDTKYIKKEKLDHYIFDHYHNVEEFKFIADSDIAIVKLRKAGLNQFNNCVFGVCVLSMSKRIMNEVMCLAEDLKIPIYYQDTDSMHIEHDKLQLLSDEFKNKYHRELIGENIMGCFHNDFDELKNAYCVFHVSLGKKMYYDELRNDKGETAEHFRMKGIPNDTIINYAKKNFNGSVKDLYLYLYNGNEIIFNLADNKTIFDMEKTGEIIHKNNFNRTVKATASLSNDLNSEALKFAKKILENKFDE